jgi:hypothetical protein
MTTKNKTARQKTLETLKLKVDWFTTALDLGGWWLGVKFGLKK